MDFANLFNNMGALGWMLVALGSATGFFGIRFLTRDKPSNDRNADPDSPTQDPSHEFEFDVEDPSAEGGFETYDPDAEGSTGDLVECSAFSPSGVQSGQTFKIQVALHLPQDEDAVTTQALAADPSADLAAGAMLTRALEREQKVEIHLEVPGTTRAESGPREVVWRGTPLLEAFDLTVAADAPERLRASVRLYVDDMPYGAVKWSIKHMTETPDLGPTSAKLKPYRKIFVSYSSRDRTEVLKRVQVIDVSKDEFFMDLLDLNAGERWEKELYRNISSCDAFYIFWSKNAQKSEWVLKELEFACGLQQNHTDDLPDIVPIILEVPPPLPPDFVSDIHFNSNIAYIIAAHVAQDAAEQS